MPVQKCVKNGKPGYRWGKEGKCYFYTLGNKQSREKAKEKAIKQGKAIKSN